MGEEWADDPRRSMTPEQRALRARIGAHISWANTVNRTARTEAARRALSDGFEKKVPAEITDPAARLAAAESLRKAFYARLSLKSAKARSAKRQRKAGDR